MMRSDDTIEQHQLPLSGVRILDLVEGPMAVIGRYLAELGAEVIRIDRPEEEPDRPADWVSAGVSLNHLAANLGKQRLRLNLEAAADQAQLDGLVGCCDILIENLRRGSTAADTVKVEAIRLRHPSLVILSISDFGSVGPCAHWRATDPVLHALSGELSLSGLPGRAPLLPPAELSYSCAAAQAVFVLLVAYLNKLRNGQGDRLDFSVLDGAAQALDPGHGMAGSAANGVTKHTSRDRPIAHFRYPIIACADGFVRICILAPRQWQGMFEWLGQPPEFADPSYNLLETRFASTTLIPCIARHFADKTRAQLEIEGARHGVPIGAILNLEEALHSEQVKSRRSLLTIEIAAGINALYPDGAFVIDGVRAGLSEKLPLMGQGVESWPVQPVDAALRRVLPPSKRPLAGLRVLDLGVIIAGAEQGRLLADQGADVIKIESSVYPDGGRQNRAGGPISSSFAAGHRNKRGLGINIRTTAGKALFLELVKTADIILSNFKAGTLDALGLGYAELSKINPAIIMQDSCAFGATGPWRARPGYGPLVRSSTGLTAQWCYEGEAATFSDAATTYPDHASGRFGAIGVVALLIRRLRTGVGGTVSISQAELVLGHLSAEIAAASLKAAGHSVSRGSSQALAWGGYRCAGDDEWCVITVRDDSDWRSLCSVMGRPDLAEVRELHSSPGRSPQHARAEQAVQQWCLARSPTEVMNLLQDNGVPAGAMLRTDELVEFPHFKQRGFFRMHVHPHITAPFLLESAPVCSEILPDPPMRPAPLLGEHTLELIGELGLPPQEIAQLVATKVLEVATAEDAT